MSTTTLLSVMCIAALAVVGAHAVDVTDPEARASIQGEAPTFSGNENAMYKGKLIDIDLANLRGGYVVLFFYPMDFTFVCPTEIIAFSKRVDEFKALNTTLLGVSTDSVYSHLAWTRLAQSQGGLGEINYPLIGDTSHHISKAYGVLKEDDGIAFRGLFIISDKGIVRHMSINDLPVGRSVDEVLRLVRAFQYTDAHGEVCPANWEPGQRTISPSPERAIDYFAHVEELPEGSTA